MKVVKPATPDQEKAKVSGNSNGNDGLDLDPLIMALLRKMPKVESGWQADNRIRWFRTFAMNVSQVYDDDDPVELDIRLKTENPAA